MQQDLFKGSLIAVITFVFFGAIIPIAYHHYADLPLVKILCWIGLVGLVFIWAILLAAGKLPEFIAILKQPKVMLLCFIGASGQILSMVMFIFGVVNGYGLAVSMSYFVLPLFYVIVGVVFFHEKLTLLMKLSLLLVVIALSYGVWSNSDKGLWIIPIICIGAVTFSTMRRITAVDSIAGLTFDYSVFSIFALITLLVSDKFTFFPMNSYEWGGYTIIALVNLVPLITLPLCIKYLPFNLVGILAWLAPTLTFLISTFIWKEAVNIHILISFVGIWTAMALYVLALRKPAI